MVSISPRLSDSLDWEEEPGGTDPRFTLGFRSHSIDSASYDEHEIHDDHRLFAASPDASAKRRRRRERNSGFTLDSAEPFVYSTVADGDAFRLAVIHPGTGTEPIECRLIWGSTKRPHRNYLCLSYCWGTSERDSAILVDGYRFPITANLLKALHNLRNPKRNLLIWIDQLCINQSDELEQGHQVSIMKHIFVQAKEVIVWLGEAADRSDLLCEYAKKMRRGQENPKNILNRILTQRQLQDALHKLLQRSWFHRVWVIPEVALARFTTVACGSSIVSWDNLCRLIRDVQLPQSAGFDKQCLLGHPRQRIAIITQMSTSQKSNLLHTDITQLLILAKGSQATNARDMIYAFYGMTLLTTFPDYRRSIEQLFVEVAHMYINSILWEEYYSRWHGLSDVQRTQQLTSILYSAGALHQTRHLPSWVPDWTYAWHLAPIWCKTTANIVASSARDEWTAGIRSDYCAGGEKLESFEVIERAQGFFHRLRLSALVFDTIVGVGEPTPSSTPTDAELSPLSPESGFKIADAPTLRYGRTFLRTEAGLVGIATPGVQVGDVLAIVLGGDVPVALRPTSDAEGDGDTYRLLCECFVESEDVMRGEMLRTSWASSQDIVLV